MTRSSVKRPLYGSFLFEGQYLKAVVPLHDAVTAEPQAQHGGNAAAQQERACGDANDDVAAAVRIFDGHVRLVMVRMLDSCALGFECAAIEPHDKPQQEDEQQYADDHRHDHRGDGKQRRKDILQNADERSGRAA